MTDGCNALGIVGEQLAAVRDRIFTLAQPQRHHGAELNAGSGLPQRKHYAAYRKVEFMPAPIHHLIPRLYKSKQRRFQN